MSEIVLMNETKQVITERVYESVNAKELNETLEKVRDEGFACGSVQVGYKTGDIVSRI